jgi:hypothetical protein
MMDLPKLKDEDVPAMLESAATLVEGDVLNDTGRSATAEIMRRAAKLLRANT